jgi:hypothetical protein
MPSGDLSRTKGEDMKVRVILVCTLLLMAALPTFALPLCGHCNEFNRCESSPGDFERCFSGVNYCYTTTDRCSIPNGNSTVLSDWEVVSVEISRPAPESVAVTTSARIADVPTPAPTHQTAELK